jgi:hypothetical protein
MTIICSILWIRRNWFQCFCELYDINIGCPYKERIKLGLASCLLSRSSSVLLQVNITGTAKAGQCFSFSHICILHRNTGWVINYKGIQVWGRYLYFVHSSLMALCGEKTVTWKGPKKKSKTRLEAQIRFICSKNVCIILQTLDSFGVQ